MVRIFPTFSLAFQIIIHAQCVQFRDITIERHISRINLHATKASRNTIANLIENTQIH